MKALPLDFRLLDENEEPVLLLEGARDLTLSIENTSPAALFLQPVAEGHHFTLRFRAGVLHDHRKIGVDASDRANWHVTSREHDGDTVIHLRRASGMSWASGETIRLTLEGLRGERARGTRATRVELAFHHVLSKDAAGPPLVGKPRHHQLVLTTPAPRELRPLLEAHFVGDTGNVVLNDGQEHACALTLRLTNTSGERLVLTPATELRVTFVAGDESVAGALATDAQVRQFTLTGMVFSPEKGSPLREPELAADRPTWTFRTPENASLVLEKDGFVEIEMGKVMTAHRNGPSSVRVEWSNLSHPNGSMDGVVAATLQKSPLVVVGRKVGVGRIPTEEGPDFDAESLREALALATWATQAVVDISMRGDVRIDEWAFGRLGWPVVRWSALEILVPGRGMVAIPWRDLGQDEWRALFAWCREHPNPGVPRDVQFRQWFRRSPYEIFFLHDRADVLYDDVRYDGRAWEGFPRDEETYAHHRAEQRPLMGLPLKPNSSLYARLDPEGEIHPSRDWVFFVDALDAPRPADAAFIARWDERGVTAAPALRLGRLTIPLPPQRP